MRLTNLAPNRTELAVGLALLVAAPLALLAGAGFSPAWGAAIVLFVVGRFITAGGLRPGGSFQQGVRLGVLAYMLVGVLWAVGFNLSLGKQPLDLLLQFYGVVLIAPLWPMQMLQAFELFGFAFN